MVIQREGSADRPPSVSSDAGFWSAIWSRLRQPSSQQELSTSESSSINIPDCSNWNVERLSQYISEQPEPTANEIAIWVLEEYVTGAGLIRLPDLLESGEDIPPEWIQGHEHLAHDILAIARRLQAAHHDNSTPAAQPERVIQSMKDISWEPLSPRQPAACLPISDVASSSNDVVSHPQPAHDTEDSVTFADNSDWV